MLQVKRLNKLFTGYRPVDDGCSPVGAGGLFYFQLLTDSLQFTFDILNMKLCFDGILQKL
jgi:hypothetical protein